MTAVDEYLQTSNHFMNDVHFVGRLNHLRTKCQEEKYNPELLQRFKQFTEILDNERKQDLRKINPSLYSIIQNV